MNNAGVGIGGAIADAETKKLDMQLDVNLRAVYLTTREAIPMLKEAGAEHGKALVANTASIAGKYGQGWLAAYSATKFGVVGLTQAIHKEHGKDGIQATALCPGFVATNMTDWVEGVPKEEMIQPEDIAEGDPLPAAHHPRVRGAGAAVHPARRRDVGSSSRSGRLGPRRRAACESLASRRPAESATPGARSCSSRTARSYLGLAVARRSPRPARRRRCVVVDRDAGLQHRRERAQLALGGPARRVAGAGVAVPGAGEAREAGAPAVAVRREHRADAAARGRCRRRR